jgi:GxxExxY protein
MGAEELNKITNRVIGAAIEVHRALGPGLLESPYETCLVQELTAREIPLQPGRFFTRLRPSLVGY